MGPAVSIAPTMQPIGTIHSPFKEKFGIPRQAGLAPAARATLELLPPYDQEAALAGLDGFTHLWLLFVFHLNDHCWRPTVRPPRLGGNTRTGVFATRSPFRPNPLGLSAVQLLHYGRERGRLLIHLAGADLADGTPVLDIKPYVPYADSIPTARGGYAAQTPPAPFTVVFTDHAESALSAREAELPDLRELIRQLLTADPRPAYRGEDLDGERRYGMRLYDFDLRWRILDNVVIVEALA
jgi:tRNA-Thr(GGU) m(6)t(6)A37 methyltransferase TsaA